MATLNYAVEYSQALAQAYPNVLHFGALYNSPNNSIYKVTNGNTIQIPVISTTGRVDGDRDTIGSFTRRADNHWETKVLANHRTWDTLIHPMDVNQTNQVMTIQNTTQVFNQEQKFPEMDAYCISKLYALKVAKDGAQDTTTLTESNILEYIDGLMADMDEANVPATGRILYVTPAVNKLIKNAQNIERTRSVDGGGTVITKAVSRIDELTIEPAVPSSLMKTVYDFTAGYKAGVGAKQINLVLVHPTCVLTPVSYTFAQIGEPSALTKGKWVYFEESFEDVFILDQKSKALVFNVEA